MQGNILLKKLNLAQKIYEEIEKKFVPLKLEKTIIIKLKKNKSKDFER
ncbi:hypothetical protein [Fusobacterium polymorphum]|nr:hypothetical protein [Fusobacterium polymorphum]